LPTSDDDQKVKQIEKPMLKEVEGCSPAVLETGEMTSQTNKSSKKKALGSKKSKLSKKL